MFERAIEHLRRLPGIGAKSAERIASWLIARPEEVAALADAVVALARSVRLCARCFNLSDGELCAVCRDAGREPILCVVEEVRDLMTLEKAGFRGRYFVLGGRISTLDRVGPESLRINRLMELLSQEQVKEVILATNPTPEGEDTAVYLSGLLKQAGIPHSRLAYGVPVGAELEYLDPQTLRRSLNGRTPL